MATAAPLPLDHDGQVVAIEARDGLVPLPGIDHGGSALTADAARRDDLFAMALCNLPHGVCMFDKASRLILCNPAYIRLYKLPARLTLPGTLLTDILAFRIAAGTGPADLERYFDVKKVAANTGSHAGTRIELKDGRIIQIIHKPLRDGSYVASHEDVSATIRAETRIRYLASHDALTGLPNRTALTERLTQELARCERGGHFALLYLDLDQFKAVNDMLGHHEGDLLLKGVTARFKDCCREMDLIARLGGDEFVVLQTGLDRPEQASALANRLIDAVSEPFDLDGDQVSVGVSIGIAFHSDNGATAEALMRSADVALYRAKLDGKNTFRFFELAMDQPLQTRRRLEIDLRTALLKQAFSLHYQPLVDAETGGIKAFEALLRWSDAERGMVPPLDFIPICEENGMIVPLGAWVLRQACMDAMHWPSTISVAVNLSSVQFRAGNLAALVRSVLEETGLPANRLELEITESLLLIDSDRTVRILHELRESGVRIALDDFGTGYSSLAYLRSFPFDKIKIDKSFVMDAADEGTEAIVRAVAGLGTALRMTTTAEGVETDAQLRRMRDHGCGEIQGFLFGRPRPAAELGPFPLTGAFAAEGASASA